MQQGERRGAIVIGPGPGLGRELALLLAREGYVVGLVGRRRDALDALEAEISQQGGLAFVELADAADPDSIARAVRALDSQTPTAVLAYNAVQRSSSSLVEVAADELSVATLVNLVSPMVAVQALVEPLVANGGVVLLVGGGSALNPTAASGVLATGKASIRVAALSLADELGPKGVRVRTITIAGLMDPKGPLEPWAVAEALWAQRNEDAVELIYSG